MASNPSTSILRLRGVGPSPVSNSGVGGPNARRNNAATGGIDRFDRLVERLATRLEAGRDVHGVTRRIDIGAGEIVAQSFQLAHGSGLVVRAEEAGFLVKRHRVEDHRTGEQRDADDFVEPDPMETAYERLSAR